MITSRSLLKVKLSPGGNDHVVVVNGHQETSLLQMKATFSGRRSALAQKSWIYEMLETKVYG